MPACVICDEVVTQPLCASCLERGIASWLQEKHPERPELLLQLEELTEEVLADGETTCIRCGNPMGLCSACYTQHIRDWMRRTLPNLAAEFMAIFSLDPAFAHTELETARSLPVEVV